MMQCWEDSPDKRPTFETIANKIEKLYERASDYIQLDKFPEEGYITLQRPGPEEVC